MLESNLGLLVDPIEGKTTLIGLIRIKREVERVFGVPTDVLTPMSLHERFRQAVLQEAIPLWKQGGACTICEFC